MTDKGNILLFPDTATVDAEAAAWVARFDAGDVSARDQAAFQAWLDSSVSNRAAIAEYGNLWAEFDALNQLVKRPEPIARTQKDGSALLKRAVPWLAACAAVAVIAVVSMVSQLRPQIVAKLESPASTHFSYETEIGARRKIALADGSSVMLNTNSRIDVDFSANRRDVHLLRGEAFFDVVHDRARPFTVRASNYVVHDIGTAFDVHLSKSGLVEVGVTKGSVEVAPAQGDLVTGPAKSAGMLVAGQQIVVGGEVARPEVVASADIVRRLAWRQGDLIYSGQPLKDVLADISRYSSIRIELADPALGNLRVGGAFHTDQIEAIFTALENNFGIHAEWIGPRHVRFTSNREMPPFRD